MESHPVGDFQQCRTTKKKVRLSQKVRVRTLKSMLYNLMAKPERAASCVCDLCPALNVPNSLYAFETTANLEYMQHGTDENTANIGLSEKSPLSLIAVNKFQNTNYSKLVLRTKATSTLCNLPQK